MLVKLLVLVCGVGSVCCLNSNDILRRGNPEFKVYWNTPTFQCSSHKIFFTDMAEKFGIVMNNKDQFRGNEIVIMYDPGFFPALLEQKNSTQLFYRNGGLPQLGSLDEHLRLFEQHVNEQIPDPNFNGVGIIDFESWRPIFRQNFGVLMPYKEISRDLEKQSHPSWTTAQIEAEATRRFEKSGRVFMEETMKKVRELRPKARWGYYAYPYCFNTKDQNCPPEVIKENDRIPWLWNVMENYYPSVYYPKNGMNSMQRKQLIQGRIDEAQRLERESNTPFGKKIMLYFWFRYRDVDEYLSKDDAYNAIATMKNSGIDGVIIWGSSGDVNTRTKCENLKNYMENVLGPVLIST